MIFSRDKICRASINGPVWNELTGEFIYYCKQCGRELEKYMNKPYERFQIYICSPECYGQWYRDRGY